MKQHFLKSWAWLKKRKNIFKENTPSFWDKIRHIIVWAVGAVVFMIFLTLLIVLPALPNIDNIQNLVAAQSSVIVDRNGEVLYAIHGDENRTIVPIKQISTYATQATLAIEDDQFYKHSGVDFGAILKAVCYEMHVCSQPRGGSTITQQFVKNAFLSSERTYSRKLKEIILSLKLESKYSKDAILEMYLNRISYGSNIFGVEVAAQTFFGKHASELTLAESAILAAIPKAPTYYSPYGGHINPTINLSEEEILKLGITSEEEIVALNADFISKGLLGKTYIFGGPGEPAAEDEEAKEDAKSNENAGEKENSAEPVEIYIKGRVDFVLSRMVELSDITQEEADMALKEANAMQFKPFRENITAPHFVMYIKEMLEAKYGKETVEKGGLKITTTLDAKLQAIADKAVADHAEANEKNLRASDEALVALNPDTGEILAMVGSRDYWNDEIDGKVNVALAPRLPGSSFKPIVYAAAFLQGYAPSTVVYDVKTKFGGWYEPENYDGKTRGPVSFREALGASLNIPAVKAGFLAGIPNVLDLARKMGLQLNQPDDWYGLSLAIGAGEVRLLDHVAAYSVFANGGFKVEPVAILKVEDKNGNILEEYEAPKKLNLILDPQVAYLVNNVLSDVNARPDDYWRGQLGIPGQINGAKTGTSNKKKNDINYPFDTWCMGYTRHLVAGVWAGNADGTQLSLKADGLGTASPIWKDFMVEATKDMPREDFEKPEGIKYIKVSKRTGKLPSENTPEEDLITGIFASFSAPQGYDDSYEIVEIDKVSGKLATEYTPPEAIEKKAFFRHHSEFPDDPNWENPVREWAKENNQDEEPPTEYDDVHTPGTMDVKPQITITSPTAQSKISPPYIGVWVNINSPAGTSKVDYYWDDQLVYTSEKSPYKGNIEIPSNTGDGSEHTIKAIAFDDLYRSSQSSINIRIGKDEIPPTVSFAYPGDGVKLPAGSSMTAQVDAKDADGDISKVVFYIDGELMDSISSPPYALQFTVPSELGEHTIKAAVSDYAGNNASESITINSISSEDGLSGDSRIVIPDKNASYNSGGRVVIKVYLSDEDADDLGKFILYAKKESGATIEIAKTDEGTRNYTFVWDSPSSGRYELYFKAELSDGRTHFSTRVPIIVR
jgi:membrane peptidoglycan carboxypeptidase